MYDTPMVIVAVVSVIIVYVCIFQYLLKEPSLEEFEAWYNNRTIDQKIDYHLDRARRYESNVDANIAQALIQKRGK